MFITPWHPIKYNNTWVYPATIKNPIVKTCSSIITLVLDNHHVAIINDYPCITLGHGFKEGILNHPFYGTNAIIDIMKTHYGWNNGHVLLNDSYDSFLKEYNMTSSLVLDNSTTCVHV